VKSTFALPAAVAALVLAVLSCDDPAAVIDPGLQLAWVSAPPETLREGDSAAIAAQVVDRDGQLVRDFDGATVSLRFTAPGDSQPPTACGEGCTATVADGRIEMVVGWVSAGSWTATACLARPDGGDDLCAERAFAVLPVQAVLVTFPTDSVGRRERFAVEARLLLPDGAPVTDLAPAVRLRFGPDGVGPQVRCPEDGPLCQRVPISGVVRLDSVSVLDTASTTLEACVVTPNGDERCDPAGPRPFRVVMPRVTMRFLTQPADGVVGVLLPTQATVEVVEPDGTRRTDFNGLVSLRLAGDEAFGPVLAGLGLTFITVRGTVPVLALNGVTSFASLRVNRPGDYRLVAEAPGAVPDTSDQFSVTLDATVLALAAYEGDNQTAPPGTALPVVPAVRVSGPADDPVAGIAVRFSVMGGSGAIAVEWDTTDATGIARSGAWTLGSAAGSQALAATAAGFAPVTFTAVADVILFERLAFITTPPDVVAGDTLPPIVIELQDAQGRRVVGGTDSVRVAVSGDNFGEALQSAVDGRVTFDNIIVTRADNLELLAWDPRYPLLDPASKLIRAPFSVAPRVQSAALTFISGGATATAGFAVDPVPAVVLSDPYGNRIPGRTVTFTATMGGGSVTDPTQVTDTQGGTQPGAWTLGPVPGINALTAKAQGLPDSVVRFATGLVPTFNVTGISAGGDFTCAPVVGTNQPYCWGANAKSQLGEGTQTARSRPTQLAGALLPMTRMAAGFDFACGIAEANGAAYCWGNNLWGVLGIGAPDLNQHATPEAALGGHTFAQISAGSAHVCALDTGGVVWCWGNGTTGQLGRLQNASYEPLQVVSTARFTQVSVGALHSCALADNGDVWCWGSNDYGQLGVNDSLTGIYYTPQQVTGGRVFTEIGAGGWTTCGLSGGSVYCWGRNTEGQAGRGSTVNRWILEPMPALGILGTARHVTLGTRHACATNGIDKMYCWGDNNRGQLGDGTTTLRASAVEVFGDTRFVAMTAGLEHTCALRDGGGAYCWGYNASGRLGLGVATNTNVTAPTQVVTP
jgi:alpha-tubulin suppressor-like RCC1 family protein